MEKLILENGKYEIDYNGIKGVWGIKRYGDNWKTIKLSDLPCSKMFIDMFYQASEVNVLKHEIESLRQKIDELSLRDTVRVGNIKTLKNQLKDKDNELSDVYNDYNRLLEEHGCI